MFDRLNNRKTTRGRRTQVITVPLTIKDEKGKEIPNHSPLAGRTRFIKYKPTL